MTRVIALRIARDASSSPPAGQGRIVSRVQLLLDRRHRGRVDALHSSRGPGFSCLLRPPRICLFVIVACPVVGVSWTCEVVRA